MPDAFRQCADRDLLRFVAAYLRSSLASYFLLIRAFQVTCDRNRVTLADIEQFPFIAPTDHPEPEKARRIVATVSGLLAKLEIDGLLQVQNPYAQIKRQIDDLIYEYFGLSANEVALVAEANEVLVPSVRPRGYKSINTTVFKAVDAEYLKAYVRTLGSELDAWKAHLGGKGELIVKAWMVGTSVGRATAVAVTLAPTKSARFDELKLEGWISKVMRGLSSQGLFPAQRSETVVFLPDVTIQAPGAFLLVRPSFRRMWLKRSAMRDARAIVERIHREGAAFQ